MKVSCVLYAKIFTSNVFIKPKLPGIQTGQTFYFSLLMTQRRPFIRERTIEMRILQTIDYSVMTK